MLADKREDTGRGQVRSMNKTGKLVLEEFRRS